MEESYRVSPVKNDVIEKLRKLYEYYCQYGERLNTNTLKSHKYVKLVTEAGMLDATVNRTRLELIYKGENKCNQMNFDNFLNSLIKLAFFKYTKQGSVTTSKPKSLNRLIGEYLLPLYDSVFNASLQTGKQNDSGLNSNLSGGGSMPNNDEAIFDKSIEEIFSQVAQILFNVYKLYFAHEISLSDDYNFLKERSYKNFFLLIKDFDICPGLVSKSAAFQLYQTEVLSGNVDRLIEENQEFYFNLLRNVDLSNINRFGNKNGNIFGQHLNFFKFLRLILKIADLGYKNIDQITGNTTGSLNVSLNHSQGKDQPASTPLYEKLILTLERMELSEGFINLEKKSSKTHTSKNASIVNKELVERIKQVNQGNEGNSLFVENNQNSQMNYSTCNRSHANDRNVLLQNNYRDFCEMGAYIVESYGQELHYIFKAFCSFGEPMNTKYLKSKNLNKLLMESNLMKYSGRHNAGEKRQPGLKMNEIDTIFIKLCAISLSESVAEQNYGLGGSNNTSKVLTQNYSYSNINHYTESSHYPPSSGRAKRLGINSSAKIDFAAFVIGIEVISRFIFPSMPLKEAVDTVTQGYILKNLSEQYIIKSKESEMKIDFLKEKQNNEDLIFVLNLLHKSFTYVFNYYASRKGLLNFKQFIKFCMDFTVFPDLLSKSKLHSFFKGISQYVTFPQEDENDECIDQSLFVDLLALIALEVSFPEPEPSYLEKILFFVEKLAQSEGPEKIIQFYGSTRLVSGEKLDILEHFKLAFPAYFTIQESKKEEFMDVFEQPEEEEPEQAAVDEEEESQHDNVYQEVVEEDCEEELS